MFKYSPLSDSATYRVVKISWTIALSEWDIASQKCVNIQIHEYKQIAKLHSGKDWKDFVTDSAICSEKWNENI